MSEVCTRLSAIRVSCLWFYSTSVFSRDNCRLGRASMKVFPKKKKNLCPLLMWDFFYSLYTLILGLVDEQAVSKHAINDNKTCM